jgi:hypothetical protein
MWVIFRKSDNEVVGLSADSEFDLDKDEALQEVVRGIAGTNDPKDFDAFQVKGRDKVAQVQEKLLRGRGRAKIKKPSKAGEDFDVAEEAEEVASLKITVAGPMESAVETHPVDKVPLIPGNGQSFLIITLQKVDAQGKPLARKKDNDLFWLRTDHGRLRTIDRETDVRSIQLSSGVASFVLNSEPAKRLATVQIFNENSRNAVQVEFT